MVMKTDKATRLANLFKRRQEVEATVAFFEREEVKAVFDDVESNVIKQIKKLPFDDYEGQKALFHEMRSLEAVRLRINSAINELKITNHNIEVENGRN